jgi:hypothetical protein
LRPTSTPYARRLASPRRAAPPAWPAAEQAAGEREAAGESAASQTGFAAALAAEEKLQEQITEQAAARLPNSEVAVPLRELVAAASRPAAAIPRTGTSR